jgi:hypothetical protein
MSAAMAKANGTVKPVNPVQGDGWIMPESCRSGDPRPSGGIGVKALEGRRRDGHDEKEERGCRA